MNARLGRCIGTTLLLVGRMCALDTPVAPAIESTPRPDPSSAAAITFSDHVAPIIFSRCAPCHRPGEAAPFDLLSFEQVQKRGRQIVEVTRSRYMPPWPPDPGPLKLTGERRLPDRELELIARWVEGGMQRGDSSRLPPPPAWTEGWALGEPDLVLEMPAAYQLAADGLDVYRNFVVRAPVRERRYIRALEVRPESRAVHHVFIKVDPSPQSRLRDELDEEPGFPGFYVESARMPEGQFVTWQPGKGASTAPPGMPWVLEPECDVIIQTHLQPIGRAETIRARIGLYFTNQPPVRSPFKLALMSFQVDIPPGATNHLVTDSFVMPVDADLLAVLPHGHLLGKSFAAEANLPDGGSLPLLSISDWDFNWQGDYSYREPVFLPRGTVLQMRYSYDNSTNNLRNPHHPPSSMISHA